MSDENPIYEITQQMSSRQNIDKDMQEAVSLITDMFRKKYINKLEQEIRTHQQRVKKEPPKEVVLLNAIKPFTEKNNHSSIDMLINAFEAYSAVLSIKNELPQKLEYKSLSKTDKTNPISDPSIKRDGIYDVDNDCIASAEKNDGDFSGIFLILLLSGLLK